jgi:hypothetical protein
VPPLAPHSASLCHRSRFPSLAPLQRRIRVEHSAILNPSGTPPAAQTAQHYLQQKRQIPIAGTRSLLFSRGFFPWRLSETGPEPGSTVVIDRSPKPVTSSDVTKETTTNPLSRHRQSSIEAAI